MNNFEAAVELSLNNWVASLPTEFNLPEPTEAYKKGIAKLMDKMRGDRYHRLTRRTARAILIAAIIMAIATVTVAATVGRDFIVQRFSDHSTYSVVDASNVKEVDDIHIGYLPEGFELESKEITDYSQFYVYSKNNYWINIYKSKIDTGLTFDTEYNNGEYIETNTFEGIYFEDESLSYSGIVWNDGNYIYLINSNISKQGLIKIAENLT